MTGVFLFVFKTQCQQELDQILERISKMPFRDNRGPLEDLYALHIPNCDKRGQYNLKQVSPGSLDDVHVTNLHVVVQVFELQICLFSVCFSARCLSTVRGASAGASTLTPVDLSHRPPL